jgi:vacuolar protein-sorting-associated protein 4
MSQADFLGRAIEQVKKAIETDTAGDYEAAYQQYYSARESPDTCTSAGDEC